MELELCIFGHPSLRKRAKEVEEVNDEIKEIAEKMRQAMHEFDGIGLAAPQVNIDLRIFVTCVPTQNEDGSWEEGKDRIYINPKVVSVSDERDTVEEGCLSVPGIYVPVERPVSIEIEALDENGNEVKASFDGLFARNFLHENDHLNGVLTVDRTPINIKKKIKPHLEKLKKKQKS